MSGAFECVEGVVIWVRGVWRVQKLMREQGVDSTGVKSIVDMGWWAARGLHARAACGACMRVCVRACAA